LIQEQVKAKKVMQEMCIGFSKLDSNFLHGFYQPATAINEGIDIGGGHLDDSEGTDSDGQLFQDEGGGGPEEEDDEDAEEEDEGSEAEQSDDGEHEKETGAIHYGSIFIFSVVCFQDRIKFLIFDSYVAALATYTQKEGDSSAAATDSQKGGESGVASMASQKGQQVGDTDNNKEQNLQTTEGNQSTGASSDGHLSLQ
jgi:hypothetical protein